MCCVRPWWGGRKDAGPTDPGGYLGGLYLFGPIGFIVGPIVCGLFLTAWDIYGAAFQDILPPMKGGARLPVGRQDEDQGKSEE